MSFGRRPEWSSRIQVPLGVVYSQTAELGDGGPMLSCRGFDNSNYYFLSGDPLDYLTTRARATCRTPWDLATYQLGRSFPGIIWRQWNGAFRAMGVVWLASLASWTSGVRITLAAPRPRASPLAKVRIRNDMRSVRKRVGDAG